MQINIFYKKSFKHLDTCCRVCSKQQKDINKLNIMKVQFIYLALLLTTGSLYGCTEFLISCMDNMKSKIVGRTMEFSFNFPYHIVTDPGKTKYQPENFPDGSICSNNEKMSWTSTAAQIYVVPSHPALPKELWVDGQNEKGLSVATLYFPGFAVYPKPNEIPREKCGHSLSHLDVQKYIQTMFSTVEELRSAIKNDDFPFVYGKSLKIPPYEGSTKLIDFILPFHWSVYDRSGDSLVLEYSKEGRRIHYNPIGVFTNSPNFDWHLTNLNNFVHLQRESQPLKKYQDGKGENFTIKPVGAGSGLLGVPGDFTPPSRFIRTAAMAKLSQPATDAKGGIIQAWHIINSVDITKGTAPPDATGWAIVKDLTNNVLYFRGYDYLSIKKIDLKSASKIQRSYIILEDDFDSCVTDATPYMKPYTREKNEL